MSDPDEDFFIPIRPEVLARLKKEREELEYFQRNLFRALMIPKEYLNQKPEPGVEERRMLESIKKECRQKD